MAGTAALAIAMALAAPGDLRLDTGVSSMGRSRTTVQDGETATVAEATLVPRLSAALAAPRVRGALSYHPLLSTPDVLTREAVSVVHSADARLELRWSPTWQLSATAEGARGTTDLVTESRRVSGGDLPTISSRQRIHYLSVHTGLHLEGSTDPRTRWTTSAAWFLDGGEDAAARAVAPLQRGVRADGAVRWNATPGDVLGARLEATGAEIRTRTAAWAAATGSWRRRITPTFDGWLGGGAILALDREPGREDRDRWLPAGELGVAHADPRTELREELVARLGATIDGTIGEVAPQLEAVGTVRWAFARRWTISGNAGASVVRTTPGDVRRISLLGQIGWAATAHVTLGGGVYGDRQFTAVAGLPSFWDGGIFLMAAADTARPRPRDGEGR